MFLPFKIQSENIHYKGGNSSREARREARGKHPLQGRKFSKGGKHPLQGRKFWKFFQNQRISKRSTEILISVWRYGTQKQYKVHLKRWQSCCSTRKINPFTALLGKALDFLTELLDEGKQYSAINTARSVLSTIVSLHRATWPDPFWETPNG